MSHPERIVPDETESGIVALHLKRYEFARPHCVSKDVLDAGCGVGYGSAYLGEVARRVVGVDVSEAAVEYARDRYGSDNVEFVVGDLLELDLRSRFDVVCAFEVIEHLREPERFVAKARELLAEDGVLIASTPRAEVAAVRPENPHHEREYTAPEFERLLRTSFPHVSVYGQRRLRTTRHRALQRLDVLGLRKHVPLVRRAAKLVTGTSPMDAVSTSEIEISASALDDATELVAVCRQ